MIAVSGTIFGKNQGILKTMNLGLLNVFLPLFAFGMTIAFLGAIKLSLAQRLGLNDSQIASFVSLTPIANMIGTLLAGYWLLGISYQWVIIGGFLLVITAIILFSQVKEVYLLIPAMICLGWGGGWLNVGSNALLAVIVPNNPASITNFAHACFGLGAFTLPLVLSYLLRRFVWNQAVAAIAILLILPALPTFFMTDPPSTRAGIEEIGLNLLLNRTMLLSMLICFCYVGIESAIAIWTTTYLRRLGWPELTASSLVFLFWFGLMSGRLLIGLVITPSNSALILQGSMIILTLTFIIMTQWLNQRVGMICIGILGLSCSPIFPTITGWLFTQFPNHLSGNIYSLLSISAMFGSSSFPYILGNVSQRFSIIRGFQLLMIPSSCLLIVSFMIK